MRRALGRGLEALFPAGGGPDGAAGEGSVGPGERWVRLEELQPNPEQPRRRFEPSGLQGLAESIRRRGVIQPLIVRRAEHGYEVIAGERRLRAAALAGLERVPVIVREATAGESVELALIENLQRQDLSPIEEAEAFRRLIEEYGLSQEEVARRVGRSRPAVANALRLLGLPEGVRAQIEDGALSAGHARALLALDSAAAQARLAREIIARGMSVREAERCAARRKAGSGEVGHRPRAQSADVHARAVEEELSRALGTRVRVRQHGRGGTIEIEFYSQGELERLINRLRGERSGRGTRFDNAARRVV